MTSHANTAEREVVNSEAVLFLVSAGSSSKLREVLLHLHARSSSSSSLQALAFEYGRAHAGNYRIAILARTAVELQERLQQSELALREANPKMPAGVFYGEERISGKLAFLYPGQGSQFPGMMLQTAPMLAVVRIWLSELDVAYQSVGRAKPSEALRGADKPELFDMETGAQLGLAASLAMTEVLRSLGVAPDCMVGHSNGEHAALVAAGALGGQTAAEACAELAKTSLLAARIAPPEVPEAMLAVAVMKRNLVDRFLVELPDGVFLAIDNSPAQIILGGTAAAIGCAALALQAPAAFCTLLPFQRAYHTPLFKDWSTLLDAHLQSVPKTDATIPVYSAAHRTHFPADAETIRHWVATQWSSTVSFRETVERMYADGVRLFVEVGPDAKLTAMVHDTLRGKAHFAASGSSSTQGEWMALLQLCGRLHAAGRDVDMTQLDAWRMPDRAAQVLATAPPKTASVTGSHAQSFRKIAQREHQQTMGMIQAAELRLRQQFEALVVAKTSVSPVHAFRLSGQMQHQTRDGATFHVRLTGEALSPYLLDHSLGTPAWGGQSLPVLAFTYTLAMASDAAGRVLGQRYPILEDVRAHRWLAMDCGEIEMEVRVNAGRIEVHACQDGDLSLAFDARYSLGKASLPPAFSGTLSPVNQHAWTPQRFYEDYAFHGPTYRLMKEVCFHGGEIEAALVVLREANPGWPLDPALLDCAGQLAALWLLENGADEVGAFPIALQRFEAGAPPPKAGTRIRCRGRVTQDRFGITTISVDFYLPGGHVLYKVTGLQQKIVDFPAKSMAVLLGKGGTPSLMCRASLDTDGLAIAWLEQPLLQFLKSQNGIWLRVLAHGVLREAELKECYGKDPSTRADRLLQALVERDTISHWRTMCAAEPEITVRRFEDAIVGFAVRKGKKHLLLEGDREDAASLWRNLKLHVQSDARVDVS